MPILSRYTPGTLSADRQASRLQSMRTSLDDLNRQLATGRRSETLGGMARGRSSVLDMQAQLRQTNGFEAIAQRGGVRLSVMNAALGAITRTASDARTAAFTAPNPGSVAEAAASTLAARGRLNEVIDQLNSDLDGQYLFSGRASDRKPVVTSAAILNGDGAKAGLGTLIAERRAADLGDGMGRLGLASSGATLSISEENPPPPFGFKLKSLAIGMSGGTVSGPDGVPRQASLTLSPLLTAGNTVTLELTLPDGSSESITLVAREMPQAGPDGSSFTLAADIATTTANLKAALASALASRAQTSLAAASATVAAEDFFAGTAETPPRRIAGPPFATATGFAAPGSRETVIWYQGDAEPGADPRQSQRAPLDRGVSVGVGARADEAPIRKVLAGFAVMAAEQTSASEPLGLERRSALATRSAGLLAQTSGQGLQTIVTDLSIAEGAMSAARSRHVQRAAIFETAIADIQHPSMEELSASILSMQTRLEASYQVTANISRLSLSNYLG